jgi:hypothetical protein
MLHVYRVGNLYCTVLDGVAIPVYKSAHLYADAREAKHTAYCTVLYFIMWCTNCCMGTVIILGFHSTLSQFPVGSLTMRRTQVSIRVAALISITHVEPECAVQLLYCTVLYRIGVYSPSRRLPVSENRRTSTRTVLYCELINVGIFPRCVKILDPRQPAPPLFRTVGHNSKTCEVQSNQHCLCAFW